MSLTTPQEITQIDESEIELEGEATADEISNTLIHADRLRFEAYDTDPSDVTTSGTASQNLISTTVWENILAEDRDSLLFEYWGTFAANSNQKILAVEWASTGDVGSLNTTQSGGGWVIMGRLWRVSATSARIVMFSADNTSHWIDFADKTVAFGSEAVFKLDGRTPTQAGDLTVRGFYIRKATRDALWVIDSSGNRVTTVAGTFVIA